MEWAQEGSLHARFLRGLALSPEGVAVRTHDGAVTYEEAHRTALSWAGALLAAPGGPPKAVGVLAGRGADSYLGILACLYAGVPAVPLLAGFPAARVDAMLGAAEAGALIVDPSGAGLLAELGERATGDGRSPGGVRRAVLATGAGGLPGAEAGAGGPFESIPVGPESALAEPRATDASDVAYVLFTSGSTGRPKGVRLTHGNLLHYFGLMDAWYDFTSADVFSQAANLNWDSAVSDLWCAWGTGATLVPVPAHAYRDVPGFVGEHGITVWFSAPSVIALVRKTGRLLPDSMPSLRWTFFGGEALQYRDTDDWQRAAPGSAVVNVYGPTEMSITTHRHRWSPEHSTRLGINGVVPLGQVHGGHEELLLDERGEPSGAEGELWLSGPQMSAGYLDPEDGRGKYLERDSRVWYRTGDRVRRVEGGELIYLGRVDAQVQVQGYRVELAEVEHALRGCPQVTDAVTVGTPSAGSTELVVFYTGTETPPRELAGLLAKALPAQVVPRHYHHVEEFPLNTNRKIDRLRLAARAAELHPDPAGK